MSTGGAQGQLPLPGESSRERKRVHEKIREAVPAPFWTVERVMRVIVVYAGAIAFVVCLASGGGVKPCAGAACQQLRSLIPVAGAAPVPDPVMVAVVTSSGTISP